MKTRAHVLGSTIAGAILLALAIARPCVAQDTASVQLDCRLSLIPAPDTDGDGLPDPMEAWLGTDYRDADQDKDTLPDGWEVSHRLSPKNATGDDGPLADPDLDGANNVQEYLADTDPHDAASCLAIVAISRSAEDALISWKGGVNAWQCLEVAVSLDGPAELTWVAIYTNLPSTTVTSTVALAGFTNQLQYFRIRAGRQVETL